MSEVPLSHPLTRDPYANRRSGGEKERLERALAGEREENVRLSLEPTSLLSLELSANSYTIQWCLARSYERGTPVMPPNP